MTETVKIVVMRHPQKNGDKITPFGAQQALAAGEHFKEMGYKFDLYLHSGAHRAHQTLLVIQAALGDFGVLNTEDAGFLPDSPLKEAYSNDVQGLIKEMAELKKAGCETISDYYDTTSHRLRTYITLARENLEATLIRIALSMHDYGMKNALAVSHSPYGEMCGTPEFTPMGIREADAVEYEIEPRTNIILSSRYIQAPFKGRRFV